MLRDLYALIVIVVVIASYLWGISYYNGLLHNIHVLMGDFVSPNDVYRVFLRRGDFVVYLAAHVAVCWIVGALYLLAVCANDHVTKRVGRTCAIWLGRIALPAAVPFLFFGPLFYASAAGRHDAEVFKAEAQSFQGRQGCRTMIVFAKGEEPWSAPPRNCAALVGIIGGRALILVNDTTYSVDVEKVRAIRFNDFPDRSIAISRADQTVAP